MTSICGIADKREHIYKAYNGKEALEILGAQRDEQPAHIDLVLLDWNMPVMDGLEALRWIRSSKKDYIKDIPVVMITGEARPRDVYNIVHEGVNGYLIKPFGLEDLKSRVLPLLKGYWSGVPPKRSDNKRSETRYLAAKLHMDMRVRYQGGKGALAMLLDISESGASVDVPSTMGMHIEQMLFPRARGKELDCELNVMPVTWRNQEDPNRIQVSLQLTPTGDQLECNKAWKMWVDKAKEIEKRSREGF